MRFPARAAAHPTALFGLGMVLACAAPVPSRPRPPPELLQPVVLTDAAASPIGAVSNGDRGASLPPRQVGPDDGGAAQTRAAGGDAAAPAAAAAPCPPEMVLVDGLYCPQVEQVCLQWMEAGAFWGYRCAEYKRPSRCLSGRMHLRVCIDREEYVKAGDALPLNGQSWTMSQAICGARGARNCEEREWQFACEGEDMHPYPYGSGFARDSSACNIDRSPVADGKNLLDLRAPATAYPRCVSPFGVHDMSGNVEEWATKDNPPQPPPMRSTMKGAWWLPGKNTCRASTVDHDENYRGIQTGVRCCKDAD